MLKLTTALSPFLTVALATLSTSCSGDDGGSDPKSSGDVGGAKDRPGNTDPAHSDVSCNAPEPWPLPPESQVVGSGTVGSCTEEALAQAAKSGGHITFDCGDAPVTIAVTHDIEVSDGSVIDGAGAQITLDGGGTNRLLVAPSGSSLSVRKLKFINGKAPESEEADGIGGAVAGNWRSAVEVRDCEFENNTAGRGGGAVSVWTGSSLTIVGSRFGGNRSYYGGAVYSLLSELRVVNSVFDGNSTIDNGWGDGGAIGTDGASESPDDEIGGRIQICGSEIRNNSGVGSGGGVYIWAYPPDEILIDRTLVESNEVGRDGLGGGMRISNGAIEVRASSFVNNRSDNHGGALYLDCAPTCTISNSTIYGNEAANYGGAISGGTGVTINNVTFAENTAGGHGGALFGGGFTLHNAIFLDNSSGNPWNQANNCGETYSGDHVLQWRSESADAGGDTCIEAPLAEDPQLSWQEGSTQALPALVPASGSPVLGAGADCEPVDQWGGTRDSDSCALGALEAQ